MSLDGVNVTVVVADTIRSAVDGRRQLHLGVPPNADLGDVLDTLLRLYPKLRTHLASERRGSPQGLNVLMGEQAGKELARRGRVLRDGQRLYLTSSPPRRPGVPRG